MTAINDEPQLRCYYYPGPGLPLRPVIGNPGQSVHAWRRYWISPNGEVHGYADLVGLSVLFRTEQELIDAGYLPQKEPSLYLPRKEPSFDQNR